jgi:hypothetical protein
VLEISIICESETTITRNRNTKNQMSLSIPYSELANTYLPQAEGLAFIEALRKCFSSEPKQSEGKDFCVFQTYPGVTLGGIELKVVKLQNWELSSNLKESIQQVNAVKFHRLFKGTATQITYGSYNLEVTSDFESNSGSFRIEALCTVGL